VGGRTRRLDEGSMTATPLALAHISAETGSGRVTIGGAELEIAAVDALILRLQVARDVAAGCPGLSAELVAEMDLQWPRSGCSVVRYRCNGETGTASLQRFEEGKRIRAILRIGPLQVARLRPEGKRWRGAVETVSVVPSCVVQGPKGPIATGRRTLWTATSARVSVAAVDVLQAALTDGMGRRVLLVDMAR